MALYTKPSEIKVGVIGYGGAFNMGPAHFNLMKTAGMTPVAVTEIDPERRKVAEADYPGIRTFANTTQMLKSSDVDLVVIITPHNSHARLARQCLRAGRHVVCEKPLAITTAECDAMIAEAHKQNRVLSTYHNRHWDGCILQAVKAIRAGAIGELYRIDAHIGRWGRPRDWWRSSRSISGGILYDWGVHLLEYSLQLIEADLTEVSGYAKTGFWAPACAWRDDTVEDEAFAVARFSNGLWLNLTLSHLEHDPRPGNVVFNGTEGAYIMNGPDYEIIKPRKNGTVTRTRGTNPPDQWDRYYQNIVEHLTRDTPLVITPEWSRRPIHIIDLAVRSARAGQALRARYP